MIIPDLPVKRAMILAAGLGERMRPLTDNTPKPLLTVQNRSLIDHVIDRLEDTGIRNIVVNAYYLAEQVVAHLENRGPSKIDVIVEETRLETGGGVQNALPLLGSDPFFVINGDAFWLNGPTDTLGRMLRQWDAERMDILLLMHSTVEAYGYDSRGDFLVAPDGRLSRRPEGEICPYMFAGIQILHPRVFKRVEPGMFSLNHVFDTAIEAGRLYGVIHDGEWFHIGTPQSLAETEAFLDAPYAGTKHR